MKQKRIAIFLLALSAFLAMVMTASARDELFPKRDGNKIDIEIEEKAAERLDAPEADALPTEAVITINGVEYKGMIRPLKAEDLEGRERPFGERAPAPDGKDAPEPPKGGPALPGGGPEGKGAKDTPKDTPKGGPSLPGGGTDGKGPQEPPKDGLEPNPRGEGRPGHGMRQFVIEVEIEGETLRFIVQGMPDFMRDGERPPLPEGAEVPELSADGEAPLPPDVKDAELILNGTDEGPVMVEPLK